MIIIKKAIDRRMFLRGAGAALALPFLDSMVPAFAQTPKSPLRLGFVYCPNGMIMSQWKPSAEGADYKLTPILEPLTPFRDDFLVIGGLNQQVAYPRAGENERAPHERAGASFLTGVHPTRSGGLGMSMDQIAAKKIGRDTPIASLELGLHDPDVVGQCEKGWSCASMRTLSWSGPVTPLPCENDPRAVFERLFGDSRSTDPAVRLAQIREDRSLLDSVLEAAGRVLTEVGPADRAKVSEYLDSIRDIERRIQTAEGESSRDLPSLERPSGVPATWDQHARLMFDLEVLAFQTGITRVITFMMGREQSDRSFREIGIADAHHPLTHHGNDPSKIARVVQINRFHTQMFAHFLERLRATPDGDGSLLDHSMIVYGGGISEPNEHSYDDLPILLAGGSSAGVRGGRYVRYSADTPISNFHLALLDKLGVAVDKLGESTGKLDIPSVP